MVKLGMPAEDPNAAAVRAARAVPMTGWPEASQAERAASRTNVLPVPAGPTSTASPSPSDVRRRTASACSPASSGRASSASVTAAAGATDRSDALADRADATSSRSVVTISLVDHRCSEPSWPTERARPSARTA